MELFPLLLAALVLSEDDGCMLTRRRAFSKSICGIVATGTAGGLSESTPTFALTPSQAALDYNSAAATYDQLDGGVAADLLGISAARREIISTNAKGDTLEVGVGTGLNLPYYDATRVKSLTAIDISQGMLHQAQEKVNLGSRNYPPTRFLQADATTELVDLFGPSSFDTVVDTFSLCVMAHPQACLRQVAQVARADTGRVLLLENTRADETFLLAKYQDLTATAAAKMGGKGCVYNQNVRTMISSVGLNILEERVYAAGLIRGFVCSKTSNP